ncbi:sensor histidine kinase [Kineosporia corallincola]|nr:PAS domain-containing sensor histidine kinase [Kineosporia corallincola]
MPTMKDLVAKHTELGQADLEWLQLLTGDWQLLSDLSFADLVLWVPRKGDGGWIAVAHCRPSTGVTVYYDDVVGMAVDAGRRPLLDRAFEQLRICRERGTDYQEDVTVREETVPVLRAGRAIAVLARHTNLSAARTPSRLELTYLQCADELTRMICEGEFPAPGAPSGPRRGAPRVGDGLIRMDKDGKVTYASPNAVSALHRLGHFGEVVDQSLSEIVTSLLDQPGLVDESLPLVLMGRAPWRSHIENHGATLSMRAVPLKTSGERTGALLLVREISELRRREQELLTKDATIREVHHRVKNNLQTVAALLRLQARRIKSPEGRGALQEAMRRVSTIALVHETLSEGFGEKVDFDDVVGRTLSLAVELAAPSTSVKIRREGRFGELRAENATPLALVLTELVTNAVEHGFRDRGGTVTLIAERNGAELRTTIRDDGSGLPEEFRAGQSGLGTQIVQALVSGEMRGRITWEKGPEGGTDVVVEVVLRKAMASVSPEEMPEP